MTRRKQANAERGLTVGLDMDALNACRGEYMKRYSWAHFKSVRSEELGVLE